MICPKCKSDNVKLQVINEIHMKNAHHSFLWWLIIGWWWIPIKWFVFTVPAIILKIFSHKKQKAVNNKKTLCVCQNCGYSWNR